MKMNWIFLKVQLPLWATVPLILLFRQGCVQQTHSLTKNYNICREKELKRSPLTPFCKACWAANELLRWLGLLWKALRQAVRHEKTPWVFNLLWLFTMQLRGASLWLIFLSMSWGQRVTAGIQKTTSGETREGSLSRWLYRIMNTSHSLTHSLKMQIRDVSVQGGKIPEMKESRLSCRWRNISFLVHIFYSVNKL